MSLCDSLVWASGSKYSYSILSWDWSPKSLRPKYNATQTNQLQNQYYTTHHIPHQSLNLFTALQYKPVGNLKPYTKLFSTQIPSQLTSFQFSIFLFLFHLLIHVTISICKIVSLCFCLWESSPNINIHIIFPVWEKDRVSISMQQCCVWDKDICQ